VNRFLRSQAPMVLVVIIALFGLCQPLFAEDNPLAVWTPKFDPSGAKYKYILSNVTHPVVEGTAVGYRIRDKVWEATNGQIYVDFRPLSQLGGEKDVITKLKLGAIQGMMSSSVAAANVADILGIVNLPYIVDTFDKLDTFRNDPELWKPFAEGAAKSGLLVADITGYGPYGWATTVPVKTLADAKKVNFRIAQAPVNADSYKSWDLKFTVMPWPDVPLALQTGVITGLDHTTIICNLTKKFTVAKNFTELNYAQGLFVHFVNKRWLNKLPNELQETFLRVIQEESANARKLTRKQHDEQMAAAKAAGVNYYQLPAADMELLKNEVEPVIEKWGKKVGPEYLAKVRSKLGS